MKKAFLVSGIAAVLLLVLVLSGFADTDDGTKEAIRLGNQRFSLEQYEQALQAYETGLAIAPDNQTLSFGAAQAAYMAGLFDLAVSHFEKAPDFPEKFLNMGNACAKLGDAVEDSEQQMQLYAMALETYRAGIMLFPRNVPLKYNFEVAKQKLEALLEDSQQEQQGDEGEEQEGEEEESQTGQEEGEGEEEEQQEQQETESGEGEETDEEKETGAEGEEEAEQQDLEEVYRILEMLEAQEEESLKNNQEVVPAEEDKNGW